jgi:hypothetical protein
MSALFNTSSDIEHESLCRVVMMSIVASSIAAFCAITFLVSAADSIDVVAASPRHQHH